MENTGSVGKIVMVTNKNNSLFRCDCGNEMDLNMVFIRDEYFHDGSKHQFFVCPNCLKKNFIREDVSVSFDHNLFNDMISEKPDVTRERGEEDVK